MDEQRGNRKKRPPNPQAYPFSLAGDTTSQFPYNNTSRAWIPQQRVQQYPPPDLAEQFSTRALVNGIAPVYGAAPTRLNDFRHEDDVYGSYLGVAGANASAILPRPDPPEAKRPRGEGNNNFELLLAASAKAEPIPSNETGAYKSHEGPYHGQGGPNISNRPSPIKKLLPGNKRTSPHNRILPKLLPREPRKELVDPPEVKVPNQPERRGGVFDDADGDGESAAALFGYKSFRPVLLKAKKRPSLATPKTKSSRGGIFDDAEDDLSCAAPDYENLMEEPYQKSPETSFGDNADKKIARKKLKTARLPLAMETSMDPARKSLKKKPCKPAKRTLVGKKETDLATSILSVKHDLVKVLVPNHCWFLGRTLWVFSVEQLECVLNTPSEEDATPSDAQGASADVTSRHDLLLHVARSRLVDKPTTAQSGKDYVMSVKSSTDASPDLDEDRLQAAQSLLRSWEDRIRKWRKGGGADDKTPPDKKFMLNGPVSCLFPSVAQRFFATVPISSMHEFLCLKKTETGAIVALCAVWRRLCKLPHATPLSLAKHLLGLGFRAELALKSVPPVSLRTRKWVGDPIVVLTGAAREFMTEYRDVLSGSGFLETRTKELAFDLVNWRSRKGLAPLKGSGKVAMISGWKANVKEAIDIEEGEGEVLHDIDLESLAEIEENAIEKEETNNLQPPAKQLHLQPQEFTFDPRIPDVDAALHSPKFLAEVLEDKYFAALESVGVTTAVELFNADKKPGSPLAIAVAGTIDDPSAFELVVFDWCQIVRRKLSEIRRVNSKRKGDPATVKDKKKKKKEQENPVDPPRMAAVSADAPSNLSHEDPLLSLSTVTQSFLCSLGIVSAQDFLSTRTTDLSKAFINWRVSNNMSVLKGQGAIASVSGWKAQIRKLSKQRGLWNLVDLQPSSKVFPGLQTVMNGQAFADMNSWIDSNENSHLVIKPKHAVKQMSHPDVLFGKSRRKFSVENGEGNRFQFELSVRASSRQGRMGIFVSYHGVKAVYRPENDGGSPPLRQVYLADESGNTMTNPFQVLSTVSKSRKCGDESVDAETGQSESRVPFGADLAGCGLIDVSKYGIIPLPQEDETTGFLSWCECFMAHPDLSQDKKGKYRCKKFATNVLVSKNEEGSCQYLLKIDHPVEKGQVAEIQFCTWVQEHTNDDQALATEFLRRKVDDLIWRFSRDGLLKLLGDLRNLATATLGILEKFASGTHPIQNDSLPMDLDSVDEETGADKTAQHIQQGRVARKGVGDGDTHANGATHQDFVVQNGLSDAGTDTNATALHLTKNSVDANASSDTSVFQHLQNGVIDGEDVQEKAQDDLRATAHHGQNNPVDSEGLAQMLVSRRRLHWIATRINCRLQQMDDERRTPSSAAVEASGSTIADSELHDLLWTPDLVEKFRQHSKWTDALADVVQRECLDEITWAIETDGPLKGPCRDRWCPSVALLVSKSMLCMSRLSSSIDRLYSTSAAVSDLQGLVDDFAVHVKSIQGKERSVQAEELDKLALVLSTDLLGNAHEIVSADRAFDDCTVQPYHDALALCSMSPHDLPKQGVLSVLATEAPSDDNSDALAKDVIFRTGEDVKRGLATLHYSWYIEKHALPLLYTLSAHYADDQTFESAVRSGLEATVKVSGYIDKIAQRTSASPLLSSMSPSGAYNPHSFQLFLGLVWPAIRNSGWRMEVGDTPNDVVFVPPGQTSRKQKIEKRARMLKQERARNREKLAKEAGNLGFGAMPKLTKRLFGKVSQADLNKKDEVPKATVRVALRQFLDSIENGLSADNDEGLQRAGYIVEQIQCCFDQLFYTLFDDKEDIPELQANQKPSDVVGCEYLARLLLLLPSIIGHSGVSVQLLADTGTVVKELADYLAVHHDILFDDRFRPPREVYYKSENTVKSTIAPRLENLRPADSTSADVVDLKETVLPEDRADLTDFIELVMCQVIPCRATQEDLGKRNRRVPLGFTGLVCRHCLGANGEGRYFFTTPESLTTAATVIEKHIQKCTMVLPDTKAKMVEYRGRHSEQRKTIGAGAQGAYFLRLWDRLRSSNGIGRAGTLQMTDTVDKDDPEVEGNVECGESEFESHVWLMDYLSKTAPWSEQRELRAAMDQYYLCLEFGGRIYNTTDMPDHFSAEWLLSKVAQPPQLALTNKKRNFPG